MSRSMKPSMRTRSAIPLTGSEAWACRAQAAKYSSIQLMPVPSNSDCPRRQRKSGRVSPLEEPAIGTAKGDHIMGILERLKPQPRWKHSDPTVRLQAISELNEPIELAALAENDSDA